MFSSFLPSLILFCWLVLSFFSLFPLLSSLGLSLSFPLALSVAFSSSLCAYLLPSLCYSSSFLSSFFPFFLAPLSLSLLPLLLTALFPSCVTHSLSFGSILPSFSSPYSVPLCLPPPRSFSHPLFLKTNKCSFSATGQKQNICSFSTTVQILPLGSHFYYTTFDNSCQHLSTKKFFLSLFFSSSFSSLLFFLSLFPSSLSFLLLFSSPCSVLLSVLSFSPSSSCPPSPSPSSSFSLSGTPANALCLPHLLPFLHFTSMLCLFTSLSLPNICSLLVTLLLDLANILCLVSSDFCRLFRQKCFVPLPNICSFAATLLCCLVLVNCLFSAGKRTNVLFQQFGDFRQIQQFCQKRENQQKFLQCFTVYFEARVARPRA